MNDTQITLAGWLGTEVTSRDASGTPVASFRVATTPRRFDKKSGEWVDGDTQWYSVTAWRQLAENCTVSLHRGDPVVVHGRLTAESWTNRAGITVTSMEVEATFVGHDLGRGTTTFVRNPRSEAGPVVEMEGEEASPAASAA
ncbi:single-stranded DNA-binding protein [Nocardioides terrisoli]|uniref:single-stranded DNA-binding protein n=1 Tax=Nocardioides terrisoli TaxID=3388267 RepID=UPI00287B9DFC|nr:single-stranded DNA-binding protein [Nocardioides marmorisolisilvae]